MKQLIVNADDFGLTPGINRAILELNGAGALSSATLMATAGSFAEAAKAAQGRPLMGVGCHIVLVDGTPLLSAAQIPHLVDANSGEFRKTLNSFVLAATLRQIPEQEIEAEAIAQIRLLQAAGVAVSHLDTHKHTHMFPRVLRPLLRAAKICGVTAIRNPFEPRWSRAATTGAPSIRKLQVMALRCLRGQFLTACRQAGVRTTDGAIGVLATGSLDGPTIRALLAAMPDGVWELCCHPGYQDASLNMVRTRLRESREQEQHALLDALPAATGVSMINFGELQKAPAI